MPEPVKTQPSRIASEWLLQSCLRPHSWFLALALTFGLGVLAANPPFQGTDEWEHFYRVFQISEGTIIGQKRDGNAGGYLPAAMGFAAAPMGLAFHPERKMTGAIMSDMLHPIFFRWFGAPRGFFFFPHIVLYSPAGYLPQTFGVLLGKLLWIGPLGLMYLARLSGYGACIGLGYAALRCTPVYRWSLLLILLAPMSLYLMGTVAQDGILITGAALLIALLLRLAADCHRPVCTREKLAILGLAALLPMAKFVYLPLAAVTPFFVLPRLPSWRAKAAFSAAYVVFCLLPVAAWGRVIASIYTFGRTDIPIDPVAQLHHVAKDPVAFLSLVGQSLVVQASDIYHKFVGVLGWVDTLLPTWFYSAYGYGLLGCLVLESRGGARVNWRQRLLLIGAVVFTVVLTYLAIYAHWNSPGSRSPIDGIHGRYFLPLAPFLVMSFPPIPRFRAPPWTAGVLGAALGATSAAVCLYAVVTRYYLP